MITVYVLKGSKRYVGLTNNLARRLEEHKRKSSKGSQIIGDFKLIYTKEFPDYKSAREHEKFLKSGVGRAWLDKFEDGQSQPEAGKACEPSAHSTTPVAKSRSDERLFSLFHQYHFLCFHKICRF